MTTDKSSVRILIYNDCGTEKFLNVFFPVVQCFQKCRKCFRQFRGQGDHFDFLIGPKITKIGIGREILLHEKSFLIILNDCR